MNRLTGKKPEHEMIYLRIKEMILFGEFVPGQSLTIHGLAELISAGVTPVREAIRRLTTEGALITLKNRRVAVPVMTESRLREIRLVRLSVEPELAFLGAERAEAAGIDELRQFDELVNEAIQTGDIRKYQEANYRFHFALYSWADAQILQRIAESLWLQIGPSLRIVCGRFGTANLMDQHHEATLALREGDFDRVRRAIEGDITQGMEFVRQAGLEMQANQSKRDHQTS